MKWPVLLAVATALAWGLYGPALAQSRVGLGSPFKPYVMIGVAYLIIAIFGGSAGMLVKGDTFAFTGAGSLWGFGAGALGAAGALTLTLAMFSGGSKMPHVVMPIVFGGAVTVSAVVSWWQTRAEHVASPWLWLGIAVILIGAVVVAYHTPHQRPPARTASASPLTRPL